MEPLLCWPDPPPVDVARSLDLAALEWTAVSSDTGASAGSWSGAVVDLSDEPESGIGLLRALRRADLAISPILVLVRGSDLHLLDGRSDLFEDFCLTPAHPSELDARVRHLLARGGHTDPGDAEIHYDALQVNIETYQASIEGRPLDLTYMEYELLKFLASNPGRVFTRETLLSRVWGYEYYGGARTVDVHIRRLRAKLGEEHAALIATVRSVGYRFGESRWG